MKGQRCRSGIPSPPTAFPLFPLAGSEGIPQEALSRGGHRKRKEVQHRPVLFWAMVDGSVGSVGRDWQCFKICWRGAVESEGERDQCDGFPPAPPFFAALKHSPPEISHTRSCRTDERILPQTPDPRLQTPDSRLRHRVGSIELLWNVYSIARLSSESLFYFPPPRSCSYPTYTFSAIPAGASLAASPRHSLKFLTLGPCEELWSLARRNLRAVTPSPSALCQTLRATIFRRVSCRQASSD